MYIFTTVFLSFVFANTPEFLRDASFETPVGALLTEEELSGIEVPFAGGTYKYAFEISAGNMGQIVMVKKQGGTEADNLVLKIATGENMRKQFEREAKCVDRVYQAAVTNGGLPGYSVQTCPDPTTGTGTSGPCRLTTVANRDAYFLTPFETPSQDFLYIMPRLNPTQLDFLWKKAFNILKVGSGPTGDTRTKEANCHNDLNPNNLVVNAGGKVKVIDWDCLEIDPTVLFHSLAGNYAKGMFPWYGLKGMFPEDKFPKADVDSGEAWKKVNLARLYMEIFGITEDPKTTFDDIFNKIENTPVTTTDTAADTAIMGQLDAILHQIDDDKANFRKVCEACKFINKRQWCYMGLMRAGKKALEKPEAERNAQDKSLLQTKYKEIADDKTRFHATHWSKDDMIADMQTIGCPEPTTWPPSPSQQEGQVSSPHSFYENVLTEIGLFGCMTFALVTGIYACTKESSPFKDNLLEDEI